MSVLILNLLQICINEMKKYAGIDNYIITMNKDYKIKIFNAEEINAKKVQTGKIIAAAIIGKTDKNVLIGTDPVQVRDQDIGGEDSRLALRRHNDDLGGDVQQLRRILVEL